MKLGTLFLFALASQIASAQKTNPPSAAPTSEWTASATEIPMRDGVKLHTIILAPKHPAGLLPIMLVRTPYGSPEGALKSIQTDDANRLNFYGYIRVFQDIRGRHKSEGVFVMLRPPHPLADSHGVDECTDTYDTIDWLVKHVSSNNGRVGMKGGSYDGWLAAMALIHPHPALKAVSPQAPVADMFLGDDFHHNGAFRLSYGFEYVWMLESGKEEDTQWPIDLPDAYDWYLRLGPLANANLNYLHGTRPSWNDFVTHPNYDKFWKRQAISPYLDKPLTVPTLLVGGWYDQEDFYGPQRIYAELTRHDPSRLAYLILGPWNHGGWESPSEALGPIDFGSQTGTYDKENIEKPWFDHWLKGTNLTNFQNVWTFETGLNRWVTGKNWPPRDSRTVNLYLQGGRTASFQPSTGQDADAFDSYVSDPKKPAPYRKGPILPTYGDNSTWDTWLLDDQRLLEARTDIVAWKTAPLTQDVAIAGNVIADLFASTTGTDSDWVVKLVDIYPDDNPTNPKLAGYE